MKTLFILGSGPSLANVDMGALWDRPTIAFNRSFIAFDDWGFIPWYFMAIDARVIKDNLPAIMRLENRATILHIEGLAAPTIAAPIYLLPFLSGWGFGRSWDALFYCGDVGCASLQVAALLGYSRAVLLGCDQNYTTSIADTSKDGATWRAGRDNDANHFRADYYGAGCVYSDPCPEAHLAAWGTVLPMAQRHIDVVSATPGSPLNEWARYRPLAEWL